MVDNNNGWKIIGIIFIIISIMEFLLIAMFYSIGSKMIDNENECVYNVCGDKYETYSYDEWNDVCYCYVGDELVYQKYMG